MTTKKESTPFEISYEPDIQKSIQLDFSTSQLTSAIYEKNFIHGRITPSKTANLTIVKNGYGINSCVATQFYIVGNNEGLPLSNLVAGGEAYLTASNYAELVIECKDMKTSKIFRLCYILIMVEESHPGCESLNSLITTLQSPDKPIPTSVEFGMAINDANEWAGINIAQLPQAYVMYDYKSYTYLVSTVPIMLTSSLLFDNPTAGGIDFSAQPNGLNFSVINTVVDADWMECEYATLDSNDVTQLLPIKNISDVNTDQSFRQIILFLVFGIAIGIFYFIIPPLYQMILWKLAKNNINVMCDTMFYLDLIGNAIFSILWIALGIAGVNSKEDSSSSIQSAFIIFVMHMITVGTISVSRISPNFPFEGREQRCAKNPAAASNGQQQQQQSMNPFMH